MRDVHSPISAHAKQKSTEYWVHVATNGERAKPDWTHCCFSCGVRSVLERVLCKKLVTVPPCLEPGGRRGERSSEE